MANIDKAFITEEKSNTTQELSNAQKQLPLNRRAKENQLIIELPPTE